MRLRILRKGDADADDAADVGDSSRLPPGFSRLEDNLKPEELPHALQTRSEDDAGHTMHVRRIIQHTQLNDVGQSIFDIRDELQPLSRERSAERETRSSPQRTESPPVAKTTLGNSDKGSSATEVMK
ncbi:hypothetical protein KFL_008560060 [Klebsormidium nitens]|uniref:Uncharacterized protein n=1 Tax=Klebsormidium nitens TaxID=105231 RepID=A0A1Y1ISP4_KLENI|nr:hypothetical protein KFL_008560060 [Klebsormidium nitens]|eukprot:GAQ91796.1 hypothetical protein KFL_008560060 [Klebsormidium nitens]